MNRRKFLGICGAAPLAAAGATLAAPSQPTIAKQAMPLRETRGHQPVKMDMRVFPDRLFTEDEVRRLVWEINEELSRSPRIIF